MKAIESPSHPCSIHSANDATKFELYRYVGTFNRLDTITGNLLEVSQLGIDTETLKEVLNSRPECEREQIAAFTSTLSRICMELNNNFETSVFSPSPPLNSWTKSLPYVDIPAEGSTLHDFMPDIPNLPPLSLDPEPNKFVENERKSKRRFHLKATRSNQNQKNQIKQLREIREPENIKVDKATHIDRSIEVDDTEVYRTMEVDTKDVNEANRFNLILELDGCKDVDKMKETEETEEIDSTKSVDTTMKAEANQADEVQELDEFVTIDDVGVFDGINEIHEVGIGKGPKTPDSSIHLEKMHGSSSPTLVETPMLRPSTLTKQNPQKTWRHLLDQSIIDFEADCEERIYCLGVKKLSLHSLRILFDSLQAKEVAVNDESFGTYLSLLDRGKGSMYFGTIEYQMAALRVAQWHDVMVQLRWEKALEALGPNEIPMSKATHSQEVTQQIIGNKPEDPKAIQNWNGKRRRLNLNLTRGRKLKRLVEGTSCSILLLNVWSLLKASENDLQNFVREFPENTEKMRILTLLEYQMNLLLTTGQTNIIEFRESLRKHCSPAVDIDSTEGFGLEDFCERVRNSSCGSKLRVVKSNFEFDIDSLLKLGPKIWLNDEIIRACLLLSENPSFIKIGNSVPIHRQKTPEISLQRPFQMTSNNMSKWRREAGEDVVGLFVLLLHNNHFTLLEIDPKRKLIHHYDSMARIARRSRNLNENGQKDEQWEENTDVKVACGKEFSGFKYIEKGGIKQHDGYSCGPIVIQHARNRMRGQPADFGYEESQDLRIEAIHLLQSAWEKGELVAAPTLQRVERKTVDSQVRRSKRKRGREG